MGNLHVFVRLLTMLRQTKLKALLTLLAATLFATLVRAETQSCLVDLESGQTILSEAADERIENNSTAADGRLHSTVACAATRREP